jgi:hypothetical protein
MSRKSKFITLGILGTAAAIGLQGVFGGFITVRAIALVVEEAT